MTDEDSVNTILSHIDNMMQYGEDEEPKVPKDMDEGESTAWAGLISGDFDAD